MAGARSAATATTDATTPTTTRPATGRAGAPASMMGTAGASQAWAGSAGHAAVGGNAGAGTTQAVSDDSAAAAGTTSQPAGHLVTFHNGGFWKDTRGERIEAHGGGFLRVDDTWYWFGEDKSGNGAGFVGVNCYASGDLVSWDFRGAVLTRETTPELNTMDRIIERPKVAFNAATQRYVMWLHWEGRNYAEAKAGVFSSEHVAGPYMFHGAFQPEDNMSRDDALFVDDDGTAYFISAANENADLIVYKLSADYLSVQRQVITLFAGQKREAPALFKEDGVYYLITSAATGWDPNQAKYATAQSIQGPWSELRNLGSATTFDTQSTYVIPVHGSEDTTYIYAGDRWQDPDLASSKYIWLPLKRSAAGLTLDYYADWTLDLTSGRWSAQDGFIPQQAWSLLHADSEETIAEDGRGQNAFDDDAATIWHTAYTDAKPGPPHELQIDLGATYVIDGMRYLPRQDGVDNGTIADYELYISQDPASWGAAVSSGSFAANHEPKQVAFAARTGRYIRFVALREINDKPYTSVAELDLSGVRK